MVRQETNMISFKRLSGRKGEDGEDGKAEPATPQKPARDAWNVVVEPMTVGDETVYAISFHRRGTSIYYLHRHYRNRRDADQEFLRLTRDLALEQEEFEIQYALDVMA